MAAQSFSGKRLIALAFCVLMSSQANPAAAQEPKLQPAVTFAKEFLDEDDEDRRGELARSLAAYDGQCDAVLSRLQLQTYEPIQPGYYPDEEFTDPDLKESHPDDLLYFLVPKSYRPDRPTGLVVFMHGGGATTGRRAPRHTIRPPEEGDDDETSAMGDVFDDAGLIAVGPSAPWDEDSYYRWCLEAADDYLADVIRECKHRYNIDRDRVFLLGHSMGGFGAFHHAQRQPDRFAAVIANAGSWKLGHWPAMRGTRLCFINGIEDAVKGDRWHYTDVAYGRWTDQLLTEQGLDFVYYEHAGGHNTYHGKKYIAKFLQVSQDLRRDPYFPHLTLASPIGYSRYYSSSVKHNRWLTLDEAKKGKIEYDELLAEEDVAFDDWELKHSRSRRHGASIEARNAGGNLIEITAQNAVRFTVWLHPRMIDVRMPVRVAVNGDVRLEKRVKPSLVTALESYLRRRDWGLIYSMKLQIDLENR